MSAMVRVCAPAGIAPNASVAARAVEGTASARKRCQIMVMGKASVGSVVCESLNDRLTRSTPSPLWGRQSRREGRGEGDNSQFKPPHPNPLPKGEREQTE